MISKSEYRKTLGTFTTGVTIITAQHEGQLFGFTANSFTSVSLDPPLVLFCVKKDATFVEVIEESRAFGINILSYRQEGLSNKFANPALLNEQRFEGVDIHKSPLSCPIIKGSLAYLDCHQHKVTKVGDHLLVLGKVKHFDRYSDEEPLLYFGGGYRALRKT